MSALDLATRVYSPWTETTEALRERHIGRRELMGQLEAGVRRLASGGRPLPIYLFGPRGVGKSHTVALAMGRAKEVLGPLGLPVHMVHEDVPKPRDAEELWGRLSPMSPAPWQQWAQVRHTRRTHEGVVFVEGLDRQLDGLSGEEQKRLRGLLDASPRLWIVATGARLSGSFVEKEAAFYGHFETIPLQPLGVDDAAALIDAAAGAVAQLHPRWPARREAMTTLAGGNPRALVVLAQAVAAAPGDEVARRLLSVLDTFTAHYQLRYRDLADNEQRLLSLLSSAPRELGPTEASHILGGVSSTWSTAALRMVDQGVLRVRQDGRRAWYQVTEPLFRHWLEYRSSPPERTRVAWLADLLERMLGPDEIIATWSGAVDHTVREAALSALRRRPASRAQAWTHRLTGIQEALASDDREGVRSQVREAAAIEPPAADLWSLVVQLVPSAHESAAAELAAALQRSGCPTLARLLRATSRRIDTRAALREMLRHGRAEIARALGPSPAPELSVSTSRILPILLDRAIDRMDRRGGVWRLSDSESRELARIPGLRARFLRHGRLTSHRPLLAAGALSQGGLDKDDPDLADLLWIAMARREVPLSARLLSLIDTADRPALPWCPWPGRRLAIDQGVLARILGRWPNQMSVLWLGALADLEEESFSPVLDAILEGAPPAPEARRWGSFELSLARLAFDARPRFERLRSGMPVEWEPLFERVETLLLQLAEAQRGPLHPELAQIRAVLTNASAM
jgi:hypothetical protein